MDRQNKHWPSTFKSIKRHKMTNQNNTMRFQRSIPGSVHRMPPFLLQVRSHVTTSIFYLPASAQNSEASEELFKAEESRLICRKKFLLFSEDVNRTEFTIFYFQKTSSDTNRTRQKERFSPDMAQKVTVCQKNFFYSNAFENITQLLIGQCQKLVTVYSVIYHLKLDIMSNVTCEWSRKWFYIAREANVWCNIVCFRHAKIKGTLEWG